MGERPDADRGTARPGAPLSTRELAVLRRLAVGDSIAEIAAALFLSESTVKTHHSRILDKLGARNRTHAVALAYQRGVLEVSRGG